MKIETPIYMDYNATTPVDPRVLDTMLPYFNKKFGNAASIDHIYGSQALDAVENGRKQIAHIINAQPEEIILKGEFVLIVEGAQPEKVTTEDIIKEMKKYIGQGYSGKETVHKVKSHFSIPKNRVYKLMLELQNLK